MRITDKSIKLRVVSTLIILLSLTALSTHYLASSANAHRTATFTRSALPRNGLAERRQGNYEIKPSPITQ